MAARPYVDARRQLRAVFVIVSLYFDVACTTLRRGLFAVAARLPQMKNSVNRRTVADWVMYRV